MRRRCSDCKWWDAQAGLREGFCRIDPPKAFNEHVGELFRWPRTKESDWCAKWTDSGERTPVPPYGADET